MRSLIIAVIIIVLVILGVMVFRSDSPIDETTLEGTEEVMEGEAMMGEESTEADTMMEGEEGDAMMEKGDAGSYQAYSPEKLALADEGDVVLFSGRLGVQPVEL